jgi:hypothetical protein
MPESREATTVPGSTFEAKAVALARLGKVTGEGDLVNQSDWVDVHFNPGSLQLQLSNELKDQPNLERKQYVAKTSAKLTMDLQFDTTDTGMDVTQTTRKIQAFIAPPLPEGDRARQQIPPPLVIFEWGTLRFKGIVETYKETIDFFGAEGVPLRASVNLTLSRQDQVFDPASRNDASDVGRPNEPDLFDVPATSASDAADQSGNPDANRQIAAANGQESLRFGSGASLTVGGSVTLRPAAAFSVGAGVSLGGGIGASAGLGVGGGAGVSLGAGAGIGVGVSLGAGVGVSGSASAGLAVSAAGGAGVASRSRLSASEGAFASLRAGATTSTSIRVDPARLVARPRSIGVSTQAGAQFRVGGRAGVEGPSGLRADVGIGARLSFDER